MNRLKKTVLTLVIAVLGIGAANAEFRFGIKAGVNVNHISAKTSDYSDSNNQAGWTAGIMTEFKVPLIGLCFDGSLMYQRLNALEDNKNFIDIPINIKYKFGLPVVGRIISPYIFTGPDFAFKLDKNTLDDFKTKTCQVAWNVGLGIELVNHLQIGASYGFGINNIADHWVNATDIKVKNNYWTITAAYLF